MNVVIYTRDMEPITIIDLPQWALEAGERRRIVRVPIPEAPQAEPGRNNAADEMPDVSLEFHPMRLMYARSWFITTADEKLALLLRPSWLPGQRAKINEYERNNQRLVFLVVQVLARGVGGH